MIDLDRHETEFSCPQCGHKLSGTIGQLKRNPTLTCRGCGSAIKIDANQLRAAIDQVTRELDKLKRTLGRLGK